MLALVHHSLNPPNRGVLARCGCVCVCVCEAYAHCRLKSEGANPGLKMFLNWKAPHFDNYIGKICFSDYVMQHCFPMFILLR